MHQQEIDHLGHTEDAIVALGTALNDDFYDAETLFKLGGCFAQRGLNGLAAVLTSAAIDARMAKGHPFVEGLVNLGSYYKAEGNYPVAERIWHDALRHERDPHVLAKILTNLSGLYIGEGNPRQALELCSQAMAFDPFCARAIVNRGLAHLELGHWRVAWSDWHHAHETGDRPRRDYEVPEWDGTPDQNVIVYGEQGLGDEIYFASCLPDMIKRCRRVVLDCHPHLLRLFRQSFPDIKAYGTRKQSWAPWYKTVAAHAAIAIGDLPRFFRNAATDWPGTPYLQTGTHGPRHGLAIGIAWRGGTKATAGQRRSIPVKMLAPIVQARPDAKWVSLQYGNAGDDLVELNKLTNLTVESDKTVTLSRDYADTAALVGSLDLVITVGTSVHHLAGALGVPNWTLVPKRPTWQYQLQGDTVPWYGSTRLYRQQEDGDWSHPISRIVDDIKSWKE